MTIQKKSSIDIREIIRCESVITLFQPLVSLKKKQIIGFEALSRGVEKSSGRLVPPGELFADSDREGCTIELDRLCRKRAFETYARYSRDAERILSINLDVSILTQNTLGSNVIMQQITENCIDPSLVVIEILEREIKDLEVVTRFVDTYRERGFLIALDDVGTGYSNLDRIPVLRPDIIKLDRSLVRDVERDFHKQELAQSIISLSHRIGSLVIAEGVERQETAITMMEMDADVLQGYYFSKPDLMENIEVDRLKENIEFTAGCFRNYIIDKIRKKRSRLDQYKDIIAMAVKNLSICPAGALDEGLSRMVLSQEDIECMYVLDFSGIQMTATHVSLGRPLKKRNMIFRAAEAGTDHSNKEYCFYILAGFSTYTTPPYVSLATGDLCTTIAVVFNDSGGNPLILCTDIKYQP